MNNPARIFEPARSLQALFKRVTARLYRGCVDTGLLDISNRRGSRVIMYHGIDRDENISFNRRFFSVLRFERQIAMLKKHCRVLPLEDIFKRNFRNDEFAVAITFDDGYENNFKYAFPILQKYQVPATFFVTGMNTFGDAILWSDFLDIVSSCTGEPLEIEGRMFCKGADRKYRSADGSLLNEFIKAGGYARKKSLYRSFEGLFPEFRDTPALDDYWKLMSDQQIREMSQSPLVTIGSHGLVHNNLGNLELSDAVEEMTLSKKYLEGLTGKEVVSIAYPDGSYTRALLDSAQKLGFSFQLAVDYNFPQDEADLRIRNRLGLYPEKVSTKYYLHLITAPEHKGLP